MSHTITFPSLAPVAKTTDIRKAKASKKINKDIAVQLSDEHAGISVENENKISKSQAD